MFSEKRLSNLKWLRTRFFSTAELAVNNQPLEFFLVVFLAIYLLTRFKAATDNCLGRTSVFVVALVGRV